MKSMLLIHKNENGMILVLVLSLLAIISLLGATAVIVTTTDIKIAGNYRDSVQAFYDADAGVNYAIAKIEDGIVNNTLDLAGNSVNVKYTAPSDFYFDNITTLTQVEATNKYSFQVTGHSGNANSTIQVVIARDSLFQYGAFGEKELNLQKGGAVYSYDSSVTPNPKPEDSTGEADVSSNEKVHVHKDTYIDGDVGLGNDAAGTEAVYKESGTPTMPPDNIVDVDRVDPDPLGAIDGDLAIDFETYSTNNDNADAGITGNAISLGNKESLTLTAGNYYLTSIKLENGSTLNIDASAGPVNIYLTGDAEFDAKKGSSIKNTGNPTDLTIYSDSKKKIDFTHCTGFKGAIYAPYADIDVNDAYGMIWAEKVDINKSGVVYFDTALKDKDKWLADTVSIVSWREILN